VDENTKKLRTTTQMRLLADGVDAFQKATGYLPLAVPEDAWKENWDLNDNDDYIMVMKFRDRWPEYFKKTGDTVHKPTTKWESFDSPWPTNIHMLTYQLQQSPESNKILDALRNQGGSQTQKKMETTGGEKWVKAEGDCKIAHPLDGSGNYRVAYQPQDPWGTPLRFWTNDILEWARSDGNPDKWDAAVQELLSGKLRQGTQGFLIESAGPDGKFGWWGDGGCPAPGKAANDNLYSTAK